MSESGRIYGLHTVAAALRSDPESIARLYVDRARRDERMKELRALALEAGVCVEAIERERLDELVGGARHQGAVAEGQAALAHDERGLAPLLEGLSEPPFLLVLDQVQDPHNLGACLRSADAAGVHAVLLPGRRAAGLSATVRRVACGAAESVPLVQVGNLARALRTLRNRGIWLVGAAGDGDTLLYEADLRGPLALVLGGEGKGLRRLTREHCDVLVRIPMAGSVASVNVSVATGICLFEAVRQRR